MIPNSHVISVTRASSILNTAESCFAALSDWTCGDIPDLRGALGDCAITGELSPRAPNHLRFPELHRRRLRRIRLLINQFKPINLLMPHFGRIHPRFCIVSAKDLYWLVN
jgi:hypothetical protein